MTGSTDDELPGESRQPVSAAGSSPLWDLIVIGAGPAGSSAARVAASAGATVLLLDRARFPRYKTCGGGLIGISKASVPASVLESVEQQVTAVRFSLRGKAATTHRWQTPVLSLVQREKFDDALVRAAVDAGATFRDGVVVRSISQGDSPVVTVTTHGDSGAESAELRARTVIGADGTSGQTGRYVGVAYRGTDLALELEVERSAATDRFDDSVYFDWGSAPGSYAWMFPKRDVITVGVIQAKGHPQQTREYLDTWMSQLDLGDSAIERSTGHLTRWRSPDSPLRRGSVIVAGDAAGLLEPWTREGISFALRSGTWAGEAAGRIVSSPQATARGGDPLTDYSDRVLRELEPDIRAGERLLRLFERHPGVVHLFLGHSGIGVRLFIRICLGTSTLGSIVKKRSARAGLRLFRV